MKEILERLISLTDLLAVNQTNTLDCKEFDEITAAISNKVIICFEVLGFYHQIWSQDFTLTADGGSQKELEETFQKIIEGNAERAIEMLRNTFIAIMSYIEYRSRLVIESLDGHPLQDSINRKEKLLDDFNAVFADLSEDCQAQLKVFRKSLKDTPPFDSFGKIIDQSAKLKLIESDELLIWKFASKLRNIIVHNNAIAASNEEVEVEGKLYQMTQGQMTQGDLTFFVVFIEQMPQLFLRWSERLKMQTRIEEPAVYVSQNLNPLDSE